MYDVLYSSYLLLHSFSTNSIYMQVGLRHCVNEVLIVENRDRQSH